MTKLFVSYRRSDSAQVTGRIYDRLSDSFGHDSVFKDVDSIPLGSDFRELIDTAVAECDVFLLIIGKDWLNASNNRGGRRLDDVSDFVRLEIESALKRKIPMIPVLVNNASLPTQEDLPSSICDVAFRNLAQARDDPDFHRDIDRLIEGIDKAILHFTKPVVPSSLAQSDDDFVVSGTKLEPTKANQLLEEVGSSETLGGDVKTLPQELKHHANENPEKEISKNNKGMPVKVTEKFTNDDQKSDVASGPGCFTALLFFLGPIVVGVSSGVYLGFYLGNTIAWASVFGITFGMIGLIIAFSIIDKLLG